MIPTLIVMLLSLNRAPVLQTIPPSIVPYEHRLRYESDFVFWLWKHQDTRNPLGEFIMDRTQPVKSRQRAWQVRYKLFGQ